MAFRHENKPEAQARSAAQKARKKASEYWESRVDGSDVNQGLSGIVRIDTRCLNAGREDIEADVCRCCLWVIRLFGQIIYEV